MEKHYFTIATGYPEQVRVINAPTPMMARQEMFRVHGNNWGFQYTEKEWKQSLSEGFFKNVKYLK